MKFIEVLCLCFVYQWWNHFMYLSIIILLTGVWSSDLPEIVWWRLLLTPSHHVNTFSVFIWCECPEIKLTSLPVIFYVNSFHLWLETYLKTFVSPLFSEYNCNDLELCMHNINPECLDSRYYHHPLTTRLMLVWKPVNSWFRYVPASHIFNAC